VVFSTTESNAFNFAASFIVRCDFGYTTTDTDKTTIEADTQSVYTNSNEASTQSHVGLIDTRVRAISSDVG
jgi:hypothetical protein